MTAILAPPNSGGRSMVSVRWRSSSAPLWVGLSWARSLPSSVSGGNALHNYLWGRSHERPYGILDQTPPFAMPVGSMEK